MRDRKVFAALLLFTLISLIKILFPEKNQEIRETMVQLIEQNSNYTQTVEALGKDLKKEGLGEIILETIKNNKEESVALVKFNEILNDSSVMEFIKKIVLTYGTEAFWRNAERNGKQIKYRKKYLKVSMLNSLKDWQNFLSKVDTNPFTREPEIKKDDDFIFRDMDGVSIKNDK